MPEVVSMAVQAKMEQDVVDGKKSPYQAKTEAEPIIRDLNKWANILKETTKLFIFSIVNCLFQSGMHMESNTMQLFQIGFFHLEIWLKDSPTSMHFLNSHFFLSLESVP